MKYCCIAARRPRGSRENRFLIILFTASIRASAAARDDGAEADALKLIAVIYMCSKIFFPERERDKDLEEDTGCQDRCTTVYVYANACVRERDRQTDRNMEIPLVI